MTDRERYSRLCREGGERPLTPEEINFIVEHWSAHAHVLRTEDEKDIWFVWTNTDLTEGRGTQYRWKYAWSETTARRLAKGKGVQGSNCQIERSTAYVINGKWYVPAPTIEEMSSEDRMQQEKLRQKNDVLQRAREAGLSEDDLKILRNS